jgi:hypothetical protein
MADIPVHNSRPNPINVGGRRIPPGDTRILPEEVVPRNLRPDGGQPAPAPAPEGPDEVLQLLDQGVKDITPELPALSDTDLARLEQAERDGKTRSTLLEAFAEEHMRRAKERGEDGAGHPDPVAQVLAHEAEEIPPILSEVGDEDLAAMADAEAANGHRQPVLDAIAAEQARRADG